MRKMTAQVSEKGERTLVVKQDPQTLDAEHWPFKQINMKLITHPIMRLSDDSVDYLSGKLCFFSR